MHEFACTYLRILSVYRLEQKISLYTRIVLIDLYGRIYLNVIFDVRCTIYKRFNDLQQQFYDDK